MCALCGCGIDPADAESMFGKIYKCRDCGRDFKGFGLRPECQYCRSKNVKRVR